MRVSVIIPAWNLWSFTSACLESLARTTPDGVMEVIVVDNGSTDETAFSLQDLGTSLFGGNFQRLRLEENLGFAKGCNRGVEIARGDLLFFLNNDTLALDGWLDPLLDAFSRPRLGACGPLLLYPDGTVQHCGIYFDPFFKVGHLYQNFPGDHPLVSKKRRLQAITGGAIMIPKVFFQQLGGFWEGFKNGFEDMDLCLRILAEGFRLDLAPQSRVCHYESQTPGRFANDLYNSELMKKRLKPVLWPDLHIFANMDGYELSIGPDLSTSLEPGSLRKKELLASLDKATEDRLELALEREPLWREGWKMLVEILSSVGRPELAVQRGLKALHLFNDRELALQLLEVVKKNSARPACRQAMPAIDTAIRITSPDLSGGRLLINREHVKRFRRVAWEKGDRLLAAKLNDWLCAN